MHHHRDPYWWVGAIASLLFGTRHRHGAPDRTKGFADPTIEACAMSLAVEAWHDMNARRLAGERWYVARERALAPRLREWNRTYGLKCAARAHEIVLGLNPNAAPPEVLEAETFRTSKTIVEAKLARGGRLSRLDAFCLNRWGIPFN